MVRELTQRSNRATSLAKMAEMLQSCSDLKDAFSVVVGMAPKIFPELRGAVLLFNPSRDKLEVAAGWNDCALPAGGFGPQDCWALRSGHAHVVVAGDRSPKCGHTSSSAHCCLPLHAHGEPIGLVHFQMIELIEFPEAVLLIAGMFAEQVGLSVSNIRLREALRHVSRSAIR